MKKIFFFFLNLHLLLTEAELRVLRPDVDGSLGSSFWTPATPPSETTSGPPPSLLVTPTIPAVIIFRHIMEDEF